MGGSRWAGPSIVAERAQRACSKQVDSNDRVQRWEPCLLKQRLTGAEVL
jgi:hypothetical protein